MTKNDTSLLKGSPILLLVAGAQVLGNNQFTWLLAGSLWLLTSRFYLVPRKLERFNGSTIPSLIGAVYGRIAQGMVGILYGIYFLLLLVKVVQKWMIFEYISFSPAMGVFIVVGCWVIIMICAFFNDASFSKVALRGLILLSLSILPLIMHGIKPPLDIEALFGGGNLHFSAIYKKLFR